MKHRTARASLIALLVMSAFTVRALSNENQQNDTQMQPTDNTQSAPKLNPGDVIVDMKTTEGDIKILLYGDTPRHRDNFVKLVNEGVYNGTLFHRVIDEFMVQAGDPKSKDAQSGQMLGSGDLGYTIEAEFDYPNHFHKRGALAAARTGDQINPERRSSASQFYVVTGHTYSAAQLERMSQQMEMAQKQGIFQDLARQNMDKIKQLEAEKDTAGIENLRQELIAITEAKAAENPAGIPENVREVYQTVGGTPHLDGQYTVFGEVIEGMDVIDRIQKVETDGNDRPKEDIRIISMTIEK